MTLQFFCPACGTLRIGNTIKDDVKYMLSCACGLKIAFFIYQRPNKTFLETDEMFQQTPLTDKKAVRARRRRGI